MFVAWNDGGCLWFPRHRPPAVDYYYCPQGRAGVRQSRQMRTCSLAWMQADRGMAVS